jgi:hypothetical protein
MPAAMQNRIRAAYENIRQLEPEVNPVKRVLLVITRVEAEVHIDEINGMDVDGGVDMLLGKRPGPGTCLSQISELFTLSSRRRDDKCRSSEANWSILKRERRGNSDYSTILFEGLQSSRRVFRQLTTTTTITPPLLPKMKTDISLCHPTQGISIRFGRSTSLGSEAERPPDCSLLLRGGE